MEALLTPSQKMLLTLTSSWRLDSEVINYFFFLSDITFQLFDDQLDI